MTINGWIQIALYCVILIALTKPLGGYLARARDPPPGNMVMWRGLTRLADITLGATIGTGLVGK